MATGQASRATLQATIAAEDPSSDVELLWEAIRTAALRIEGYGLPFLKVARRMTAGVTIYSNLERSAKWLLRSVKTTVPHRRMKLALFQLAAESVVKSYPVRSTTWVYLTDHITEAVEADYPGYHSNDMLCVVAEKISEGLLTKEG